MGSDLKTPLWVFLASRLGLVLVAYFALVFIPRQADVVGPPDRPPNLALDGWARWDSAWFLAVAEEGYSDLPDRNQNRDTRFFPLYPLLIRWLGGLTGNLVLAGVVLSNLSFLLGVVAVHALARERLGREKAARAVILLCFFPFSYYFSAVYSESLFLACAAGAFWLGEIGQWTLAALAASMAGATQPWGFLVGLGLAVRYLEKEGRVGWSALALVLSFVLPAFHLYYLQSHFGQATSFLTPVSWQPNAPALTAQTRPQLPLPGSEPLVDLIHLSLLLGGLLSCGLVGARLSKAWGLWGAAQILVGLGAWQSMGAHVAVAFPLFILWAQLLPERALGAVVYGSILLLGLLTWIFVTFNWTFIG